MTDKKCSKANTWERRNAFQKCKSNSSKKWEYNFINLKVYSVVCSFRLFHPSTLYLFFLFLLSFTLNRCRWRTKNAETKPKKYLNNKKAMLENEENPSPTLVSQMRFSCSVATKISSELKQIKRQFQWH